MWIILFPLTLDQCNFSQEVHLLLSTLRADSSRALRNLMNGSPKEVTQFIHPEKLFTWEKKQNISALLGIHRSRSSAYSNILQWKYVEHGKLCAFQGWLTKSLICKTHIRGNTSSETCRGMTSEKYCGVAQSETRALFSYSFMLQVPVEYGVKGCIAVQRTDSWFAHDSVAAAAHRRGN